MVSLGSIVKEALVRDFGKDIAAQLEKELEFYEGKCYYNEGLKKIVYYDHSNAFHAYMEMQRKAVIEHRKSESEKNPPCLDDGAELKWIRRNAQLLSSFWKRTHTFTPSEEAILEYIPPEPSNEDF